ncbi:hypothetical protein [Novilysobacter erysipheiresistens]|uniref:Uncharacterized protein n=1 Tax=Novilysobacter erysipheiresistens TaxID=1749332 RepID=A0ABU7YXN0_9GAMM
MYDAKVRDVEGRPCFSVSRQDFGQDEKVRVAAIEVSGVTVLGAVTSTRWLAGFVDSIPALSVTPSTCIVYGKPEVEYHGEEAKSLEPSVRYALGMNAHVFREQRWQNRRFQAYFCIAGDRSASPRVRQVEWDEQSKRWRWDVCALVGAHPGSEP